MSSSSQSGFGSRLENSKFLISVIKTYSQYNPSLPLIQISIYEPYVNSVEAAMSPFSLAKETFDLLDNDVRAYFESIVSVCRSVRNVIIELFGRDSGKYADYNELIDKITGDNITKNSYKRNHSESEENPDEDFQSVAQVDRGSRLANFAALVEMLKNEPLYDPQKNELKVVSLQELHDQASSANQNLATAYGTYTTQRAVILPLFDGPEGLTVRAERAKAHLRSVYGPQSPELKALTGKTY